MLGLEQLRKVRFEKKLVDWSADKDSLLKQNDQYGKNLILQRIKISGLLQHLTKLLSNQAQLFPTMSVKRGKPDLGPSSRDSRKAHLEFKRVGRSFHQKGSSSELFLKSRKKRA